MTHTCHAIQCDTRTKPEMFMCLCHWRMVPRQLQRRIWATYRSGQCDDWQPSARYCTTAREAVELVAKKEGIQFDGTEPELMLYDFLGTPSPKMPDQALNDDADRDMFGDDAALYGLEDVGNK